MMNAAEARYAALKYSKEAKEERKKTLLERMDDKIKETVFAGQTELFIPGITTGDEDSLWLKKEMEKLGYEVTLTKDSFGVKW